MSNQSRILTHEYRLRKFNYFPNSGEFTRRPAPCSSTDSDPRVRIRISPVIEREFKRRNVFPELRLEKSLRVINGATGIHLASLERAREVLADAQAQRNNSELPRGLPVAYGALVRNINDALREESRRGLIDDPGIAEVQRQQSAASACFTAGDGVLYFGPGNACGGEAVVVGEYQLRRVLDENGSYITCDEQRIEYRAGYTIRLKGSDSPFFAAAYQLTRYDRKPSHLRLVTSQPTSALC